MGIHGAGMTAGDLEARLGFCGVEINQDGPITDEEADLIAKKIAAKLPERIYAYSRGSAALNKAFLDDDMPASVPPVTYIAPAALRSRWGTPPIPKLPAGSITIVGDSDRNIPDKHHTSILYTGGSTQGATKLDPGKCLADKEMPDWGDETVEKDSPKLQTQKARVRDLTGEALVRAYIFETIR